jgi:hypothetical protein
MALILGSRLGPYEIIAPVGKGGMGEVYRAHDARLGRDVAVKILSAVTSGDSDQLRRFEQEARAAAALNHPNILAVHDIGTFEGQPYVVSELLEGQTLREALVAGALPPRRCSDYAVQLCQGLAAAHDKGIVHRDLKPENVFITRDGRVKILDFGLAKLMSAVAVGAGATLLATHIGETTPGVVLGTVGYMSPEQVRGEPADARSDIFSFGAILYEMLAGGRAFTGGSAVETMSAILKEEPPDLVLDTRGVSPAIDRLVRRCLEKSPDERFQSARDLRFALEAVSAPSGSVTGSGVLAAVAVPGPTARRPRGAAFSLTVALVLLTAGLTAWATARYVRGTTTLPVYQQLTFRVGMAVHARFGPDGDTVVYTLQSANDQYQLHTLRVGSLGERPLGIAGDLVSLSRSGEMLMLLNVRAGANWIRLGTLARAPLAGGSPRELLADVSGGSWSPDGSQIALTRFDVNKRLWRLEYPVGTMLYESANWLNEPHVSPQGDAVTFLEHPSSGDDRGVVAIVDTAHRRRALTPEYSSIGGMAWAPTGEVWFTASTAGSQRSLQAVAVGGRVRVVTSVPGSLMLEDVSPTGRVLLANLSYKRGMRGRAPSDADERDLTWLDFPLLRDISDDGSEILFEEEGDGGGPNYTVFMRKTDGTPAVQIGTGYGGRISPNRQWASTLSVKEQHLTLVPLGPGEPRPLSVQGATLNGGWFPDNRRMLMTVVAPGNDRRVVVVDTSANTQRDLTPPGYVGGVVTPDGKWAYVRRLKDNLYAAFPIDGGTPHDVPGLQRQDTIIRVSGDGRSLFVASARPEDLTPRRIFTVDPATGRREQWKTFGLAGTGGVYVVTAPVISADGRAYAYSYGQAASDLYAVEGLR